MARVRRLEFRALKLAKEAFSGEYHSAFKGQGLDFDEFKEYHPGDEPRFIDWNVTARSQTPYVRTFKEDRDLDVILLIDVSGSTLYGSNEKSKRALMARIAATLAFAVTSNHDKIGLILFSDKPLLYLPPHTGRTHVLRIIREIIAQPPPPGHANLDNACLYLNRLCKKRALVFLISDFQDMDLNESLMSTAYRHDMLALRVEDPAEQRLPRAGLVGLIDPETLCEVAVNTNSSHVRAAYHQKRTLFLENLKKFFHKADIDYASFSTTEDFFLPLHELLLSRSSKRK